ncbi:putative glycoside hydrolase family 15 protein [Solirubrobacter taibaiensis]|nr:putative glycoside hydrolase family 15 protein [Solirubrobacter taibaiensis]
MVSLLCALSILGCTDAALGAAPARDRAGLIHFARAADSSFDRFTQAPTPAQQAWMRTKYWRMRTYSPYFDSRTAWYSGAWSYRNAMAIYPNAPKPEDWYLRDAQGRKLYIWYACGGGTCTQFAGDIGSPAYRAAWIADAKGDIQKGYKGLFVDDVNMQLRISDGNGNLQWPIDPRTGSPMNDQSWRRYMAEFMEQIRREIPTAEIVHNSLWFDGDADPYIQRQHNAADLIEIERGINDSGLRGGEGVVSLRTLLKLIDRLHAKGKGVVMDASAPTHAERVYGLAGYFLISEGRDAMGNYQAGTPDDWWAGYDTDLGEALGARYDLPNGVIRRDFTRGTVLLNTPDTSTQTVSLGAGYRDVDGVERSAVTLAPGTGAVLLRTSVAAPPVPVTPQPPAKTETTIDAPTAPNVPTPTATPTPTPTPPAPSGAPTASISSKTGGGGTSASISRVSGKRVKISGRVAGATSGKVKLVIQRKTSGKWKTVRTVAAPLKKDGSFAKTLTAAAGNHRVQARFAGTKTAKASRSSYRTFSARRS